ncbi:major capsid protein [uncultured Desulfosarcina sp.]|uniref:major capsid protein n=1 Tax=uncultured Desulfosarcina sp. TaxID=218289 RepID=UPI0029C88490|nr:major capsid protein [uncultured Desulfosarcina sp.]
MDDLFRVRTLTQAVNAIPASNRKIYNRIFTGKERGQTSDLMAFDVITGSEGILKTISVMAPATVDDKTSRKTVTLKAPRLSNKRFIHVAELNSIRAMGEIGVETMKRRIAIELKDMRNKHDRTLEFWAVGALKGMIYDSDLSSVLVDYNVDGSFHPVLTGNSLWTDPASNPITTLRAWKKQIEDNIGTTVLEWVAFLGSQVMGALLEHSGVLAYLIDDKGSEIAENGRISRLAGIELIECNHSFRDESDVLHRLIDPDSFLLVGVCDDLVEVMIAPVVDDDAPFGVGNVNEKNMPQLFFSKSWKKKDPSGRWIKCESRPLPVLRRPGGVIFAKAV